MNSPYPQTPEGLAGQQTALNAYDSTELVTGIKVPTLVIAGEADGLLPLFNSQFLAKEIPSAKLAIIKGDGHMPQYEKPQQLLELIKQFCR